MMARLAKYSIDLRMDQLGMQEHGGNLPTTQATAKQRFHIT
jgi:hypothetical protein